MSCFYTPRKHQKTKGFLTFSGAREEGGKKQGIGVKRVDTRRPILDET